MASNSETGIVEILSKLDEDNLLSLGKLVTQGLLKINSKDDAIRAILKHSPDNLSILRRKSVTREILFAYLDENNVIVKIPITKNELIDKIMEFWNGAPAKEDAPVCLKNEETISKVTPKEDSNSISALAEQFAGWFYSLMNDEGVGAEHFYPDAKLKINLHSNNDCDTTIVEDDPDSLAQELLRIKLQHGIFFNPNITKEGTQGRMDPHGLVIVLACGTLHAQTTCVGVFEQVFSLARDPFCDNNWKIKNSELNLRSKSAVMGQPRLCESELTSNLLSLPSS